MTALCIDATFAGPGMSGAKRRLVEMHARVVPMISDMGVEIRWSKTLGSVPTSMKHSNARHTFVDIDPHAGRKRWQNVARHLRTVAGQESIDVALVDHGPIVSSIPTLVTVHDLRFLHGYASWPRRIYGRLVYGKVLKSAAHIVTVSDAMKSELMRAYGLSSHKITAIYNATSLQGRRPPASSRSGLLMVGRDEPRKQCAAGHWVAKRSRRPLTHLAGGADDCALQAAYSTAEWLLAPSAYEGSHIPVMEALALGLPVIASDIPAHRELLDRGARGLVLVPAANLERTEIWPEALAALQGDAPVETSPPPWTWDDAAHAMVKVLRSLI